MIVRFGIMAVELTSLIKSWPRLTYDLVWYNCSAGCEFRNSARRRTGCKLKIFSNCVTFFSCDTFNELVSTLLILQKLSDVNNKFESVA